MAAAVRVSTRDANKQIRVMCVDAVEKSLTLEVITGSVAVHNLPCVLPGLSSGTAVGMAICSRI
jgi:hypothetical protein